jgi:hypothetical protein
MQTPDVQQFDVELWEGARIYMAGVHFGNEVLVPHMRTMYQFMLDAFPLIKANRIDVQFDSMQPLDWRRSIHAQQAIHPSGGYTHLFFFDTDMEVSLAHLQKLLSRRVDVITGTYFMGGRPLAGAHAGRMFPCVASRKGEYIQRPEIEDAASRDALIPVDSVGCGCLLVTTEALRRIGTPAFKYNWIIGGGWTEPEYEDSWFSRMAKNAGIEMMMDPTVRPDHFKLMRIGLEIRDMNNTITAIPTV